MRDRIADVERLVEEQHERLRSGDWMRAHALGREATAKARLLLQHPRRSRAERCEAVSRLGDVAVLLSRYGQAVQAQELLASIVAAARRVAATRIPDPLDAERVFRTLGRLTSKVWKRGFPHEAYCLARSVARHGGRALGPDDPIVLDAKWVLGHVLFERRPFGKALSLLEDVVTARSVALGDEHPSTSRARRTLRHLRQSLSVMLKDLAQLRDDLRELRRSAGRDHDATLIVQDRLATVWWAFGQPRRARRLLEDVLMRWRTTHAAADARTLSLLVRLAKLQQQLGEHAACIVLLDEAAGGGRTLYGHDAAETRRLARLLDQARKVHRASRRCEQRKAARPRPRGGPARR